jgi:hypothetical protein
MNSITTASLPGAGLAKSASGTTDGVVEIGLLLPTNRAAALMRLAQDRRESVGQVLRELIDRELARPA